MEEFSKTNCVEAAGASCEDALVARVLKLHEDRCNCAQSIACAFADCTPYDSDTLFRMMEGFGAGMGGHTETCGAVSAGVAVISACASDGMERRTTKEATYVVTRDFVEAFAAKHGTTVCGELKKISPVPTPHRCDHYMDHAARLLARTLGSLKAE